MFCFWSLWTIQNKERSWCGKDEMINIGNPTVQNNELLLMSDLPSSQALHPLSINLTRESRVALITPSIFNIGRKFHSWLF